MRNKLSIIVFSLGLSCSLFSQDIEQLKEYADDQNEKGFVSTALKEYQRVLLFDTAHHYNDIYEKIATLYYRDADFENALVYFDFAWKAAEDDSLKHELTFRKILCHYRLKRFMLGLSELYDMPDGLSPYFEKKKNLYLAICHFGLEETGQSLLYFAEVVDTTGFQKIDSTLVQLQAYQKKFDPDRLEMMSIFLPGLGQAYAGDVGSAINSLLLLSGIAVYSYHTMITYTILDGTLVLISWLYRYYTGGHRKAYQLGAEKIAHQKNLTYLQLLEIVQQHTLQ